MNKHISILAVLLLTSICGLRAQKYSNEFLAIGVGARAHGMSGAQTALVNDITAGYWNPAGLSAIEAPFQIGAMHAEWFVGVSQYDYLAFGKSLDRDRGGYLAFSLIRLGIDNIPYTINLVNPDAILDAPLLEVDAVNEVIDGADKRGTWRHDKAARASKIRGYHAQAAMAFGWVGVETIARWLVENSWLGFGHNARAALITRGLSEIGRLALKMGGNALTLSGLAGMGDLVLTCTGQLSRNRHVGVELGKGRSIDEILGEMRQVAEGVRTAKSAHMLARREGVYMPIVEMVHAVLYENLPLRRAVSELMNRSAGHELD
jgi:hypothetical protein